MKLIYPLRVNPAEVFLLIRQKILNAGGNLIGDWKAGAFTYDGVSGNYKVVESNVEINITEKPFYVFDFFIKREFDSALANLDS